MTIAVKTIKTLAGFTIIEQLVALVVVSTGMLAMANLQVSASQADRDAIYRTRAISLTSNMAESIRANRQAARDGGYVLAENGDGVDHGCGETTGILRCTVEQMAEQDLFAWKQQLANVETGLPKVVASIGSNGANDPTYTINLSWASVEETSTYNLTVAL